MMHRIDRERMPATIAIAVFLSGAFVLAWAIAGMCLVWIATAFAAPASAGTIALWAVVIVLGVAANVAVILGIFRRENWARWIVVMQSLVLTIVLIAAGSLALWGILAVAIHAVLVVVPPSNTWFRYRPVPRNAPSA